jgi:hypothetical protein
MQIQQVLEVLEATNEQAKENVTFWDDRLQERIAVEEPQRLIDQAANAKAIAKDRVTAISTAIAIVKAAKEAHDIFEDIVNNPEDWPAYQVETARRLLLLLSPTDTTAPRKSL